MERITTFEIPEEIAKHLSILLIKEKVRKELLLNLVGNKNKFEEVEQLLIEVSSEIEKIKHDITTLYVPEKYRSEDFIWDYNGFDIDGKHVTIYKTI